MGNPLALPGRQQKFDRSGGSREKLLLMSRKAYEVVILYGRVKMARWDKQGRMCLFSRFAGGYLLRSIGILSGNNEVNDIVLAANAASLARQTGCDQIKTPHLWSRRWLNAFNHGKSTTNRVC